MLTEGVTPELLEIYREVALDAIESGYAQQASEFLQRSQAESLPTKIDANGVIRTYDPATNTFGAYNADGTTRTFFSPDPAVHGLPTNLQYWGNQSGGAPWTP